MMCASGAFTLLTMKSADFLAVHGQQAFRRGKLQKISQHGIGVRDPRRETGLIELVQTL